MLIRILKKLVLAVLCILFIIFIMPNAQTIQRSAVEAIWNGAATTLIYALLVFIFTGLIGYFTSFACSRTASAVFRALPVIGVSYALIWLFAIRFPLFPAPGASGISGGFLPALAVAIPFAAHLSSRIAERYRASEEQMGGTRLAAAMFCMEDAVPWLIGAIVLGEVIFLLPGIGRFAIAMLHAGDNSAAAACASVLGIASSIFRFLFALGGELLGGDEIPGLKHSGKRFWWFPAASGTVLFAGIFILCLIPSILTKHDFTDPVMQDILLAPSATHLLGTDYLGRDVLSRILHGGRLVLLYTLGLSVAGAIAGTGASLLSRVMKGHLDFIADIPLYLLTALPPFLVFVILLTSKGAGLMVLIAIGLISGGSFLSHYRQGEKRNLDRGAPLLISSFFGLFAEMTAMTTMLSAMGFLTVPPSVDWGIIIAENEGVLNQNPLPLLFACSAVFFLCLAAQMVSDGFALLARPMPATAAPAEEESSAAASSENPEDVGPEDAEPDKAPGETPV